MSNYTNPWTGLRQFYKGKSKKSSEENDKDYIEYCKKKKNKDKILPYNIWCKRERKKSGLF